MGKLFSRLKGGSNSSNRYSTSYQDTNGDNNSIINSNNNKMTNNFKLIEQNNYVQFENVLHVCPAGNSLCLFGQDDYSLNLFDFNNEKLVAKWQGHEKDITKVLYCAKLDKYLSASRDRCVKLWTRSDKTSQLNLLGHDMVVTALATNLENTHIITGSRDNKLNLWDLSTGKLMSTVNISRNLITDACWSLNSKILLQSSEDKEIRIWDPFNLKVIHSFPKKQYIQSSCHISQDNNYAISTSNGFQGNGCEITIWDLRKNQMVAELTGHEQTVTSAKIIDSDRFIASCSNDATVKLWDFKTHDLIDSIFLSNGLTSISEESSSRNLIVSSLSNGIYKLKY